MQIRSLAVAAFLALGLAATPALAKNDHTPPGNPCAKGNGNPCGGNEGNAGAQGNAHRGGTAPAPPISIPRRDVVGRAAYVTQIGDGNHAEITQPAPTAYARVKQTGDDNSATVDQHGSATGYVELDQTGSANDAVAEQGGLTGNTAYLIQHGNGNSARSTQTAGATAENGAILRQTGDGNGMTLTQDGNDNLARLEQAGNGNTMAAQQLGNANRLVWTQTGDNLNHMGITQSGGASMQITQAN